MTSKRSTHRYMADYQFLDVRTTKTPMLVGKCGISIGL
ncbi:hypothetical protein D3OALGA1CA_4917 [Olavius algarvensis associated proteobacterium Delta 3]|nr:hypothetical protein D3OALGB2SA_2202 [Olavius algarvensis associated proteobacterium Delta 3]CAB5158855.1 hypothetical protein D3OALGA1CA_4917 [Olavius algarvensis associated proteobacterium Delta 3]